MKLFLDDIRVPRNCVSYMHKRIGALNPLYLEEWNVVRNYEEFVSAINDHHNEITHISFDHDLAEAHYDPKTWTESFVYKEKTGLECAKYMKWFYDEHRKPYPIMFVHSMNPVGTQNIINLFLKK
jgi:hypothetical protein